MTTLSVVIPTTHRIDDVMELARQIDATSPIPTTVTVVDNGPHATETGWDSLGRKVIVRDSYLGSEQAFLLGLRCAPKATWYLLLDHDARLYDGTLSILLSAATGPDAVYSGNQNGDGSSWDRRNGRAPAQRDLTPKAIRVEFAPWSGLLLSPGAVEVISSHNSGFFFFWDDYFACWLLRRAGYHIWGVPGAVVENEDLPNEKLTPWRAYYKARNHILFHNQTGYGGLFELVLVEGKDLCMAFLGDCRVGRVRAITQGIVDGIRGRRGPQMLPA